MRVLFLTIEFASGTFSGNGIYAQSQVRALRRLGHPVLVLCGCPHDTREEELEDDAGEVVQVRLSAWGRLDGGCAHAAFAAGCAARAPVRAAARFGADVVLGVDWHSLAAYDALVDRLAALRIGAAPAPPPPYVHANYRVHLRSAAPGAEAELIEALEGAALRRAAAAAVLSRADAAYVAERYLGGGGGGGAAAAAAAGRVRVLLPALRHDVASLPPPPDMDMAPDALEPSSALGGDAARPRRRYLLCCVRAAPEKEPARFVALAAELQRRGALDRLGLTVLVCGSGWAAAESAAAAPDGAAASHGAALGARLRAAVPGSVVVGTFLGAAQMGEIFAATALNVHPPLYDAFGLTIVEAASQGAPSLVHAGGGVGATDLLSPAAGQIFETDMGAPVAALADEVERLLGDAAALAAAGRAAMAAARGWDEDANGAALAAMLRAAVPEGAATGDSEGGEGAACGPARGAAASDNGSASGGAGAGVARRGGVDVRAAGELQYREFVEQYLDPGRPLLLTGATEGWRAAREWVRGDGLVDVDFLARRFGESRVGVTDAARRHRGEGPCREMSVAQYAGWWRDRRGAGGSAGELLYLKDWHFVAQWPDYRAYTCPALFSDDWLNLWLDAGGSGHLGDGVATSDYRFVYLGPAGSSTPLHADVLRSHSWSANLAGRKRWRLLPPGDAHLARAAAGPAVAHDFFADLDLDLDGPGADAGGGRRFPGLAEARLKATEVVQLPGEALFVPSGHWHTVDNLDDCVSINHNWVSRQAAFATWAHLREERAGAAAAIADCAPLCGAFELEWLAQRNAALNCALSYASFGAMLRCAADDASTALAAGGGRPLGGFPAGALSPEETVAEAGARLRAAHALLGELYREQAALNAACAQAAAGAKARAGAGMGAGEQEALPPDYRAQLLAGEAASREGLGRAEAALAAAGLL